MSFVIVVHPVAFSAQHHIKSFPKQNGTKETGDSRNKTRPAKVVVVANSKQKCSVRTHNVVKYTSKNFGYEYTLYCL